MSLRKARPRSRKDDHLDLCATADVAFRAKTTLFEEVELVHEALPERALADVDVSTTLLARRLSAPVVIAAMTGGVPRAERINADLATVAEEEGLAFTLGSQRPLLAGRSREGYFVRERAPSAFLLGNVGLTTARDTPVAALRRMLRETRVDALVVHLNPAMECVQPEGEPDFRRGLETIRRLSEELGVPVVAKETGAGISRRTAERLVEAGVEAIDVGGAGGTSFVAVEGRRASGVRRALGESFRDWGIPTAASLAQVAGLPVEAVATGGVADGLAAAKALALGAVAVGVARPLLRAWTDDGVEGVRAAVRALVEGLRVATFLAGVPAATALSKAPLVVGERLLAWTPAASPLRARLASAS